MEDIQVLQEQRINYPFAAIVGQDALKQALLLCAIDPSLGGVLAMGDRGTGKTTALRGLAALLPKVDAVAGCPYRCDPTKPQAFCSDCATKKNHKVQVCQIPVVDLPLGASEDRLLGALDIERALIDGQKKFEPGLLAKANRGFLYIDEVNLLEDHLVDALLDVAASGINAVEREGLSVRHPARFVLVGSCNPEEGELRPQLLDRFGLCVEVSTPGTIEERVEIIKRRTAFEADPHGFAHTWKKETSNLSRRVSRAKSLLPEIHVSDACLADAAELCISLGTDGLRGELTLVKAAAAKAAWSGSKSVTSADLQAMAVYALGHRLRRDPLDDARGSARVERALGEFAERRNAA